MRLNTIILKGYRCFEDTKIKLNEDLTVLVANNGAGKTSILDAIATAFGAYLTRLPRVQGHKFSPQDLHRNEQNKLAPFMAIYAQFTDTTKEVKWTRIEKRDQLKKTQLEMEMSQLGNELAGFPVFKKSYLKEINEYADEITEALNEDKDINIPVLAYYGTGRGVFDIPARRSGFGKDFERLDTYTQCLDPKTNFRKFFEYFYFLEDAERREKEEHKSFNYRKPELEVIRKALNTFLTNFSNPRTEISPLRFILDRNIGEKTEEFNIEMLSDGYRTSIAMVMDLASRMAEANPHLGADALQKTSGVVLIDEVDMHLHPSWQQTIITDLQRTFPQIQFICTTHSPQVLSTVLNDNIRIIMDDHSIQHVPTQTKGSPSHEILAMVMNVDPRPDLDITKKLSEYTAWLEGMPSSRLEYEWDEIYNELTNHYGLSSPQIIHLDNIKRFQSFKQQLIQEEH